MVLPVNVWGTDISGKPFRQLAYTLDISTGGARLAGITARLSVGNVITVRYKQAKARFQIAWVNNDNIGIQYVKDERFIWVELPEEELFFDREVINSAKVISDEPKACHQATQAAQREAGPRTSPAEMTALARPRCSSGKLRAMIFE